MNIKTLRSIMILSVSIFTLTYAPIFSQTVVRITDCNLNGWVKQIPTGAGGKINFIHGPSQPPQGNGSVSFVSDDKKLFRMKNDQYLGTLLSSITELSFSTFIEQRLNNLDNVFVVLTIDSDNNGVADFPLVFNSEFQSGNWLNGFPDQGSNQPGIWQTWNMLAGGWWQGPTTDPYMGGQLHTLAYYLQLYPNAVIRAPLNGPGAIRINGASPVFAGAFTGSADAFKIGINGNTIIYDFEDVPYAGPDQTMVYGYGSNCTTLTGSAANAASPYSYAWSGGGLSATSQSIEVCPTATTIYTLTVTDGAGCITTDKITVIVNNVKCGNANTKVFVCHNNETICVASTAVAAHLAHGDYLGACTVNVGKATNVLVRDAGEDLSISNYPNPSKGTNTIKYRLPSDSKVSISVYDLSGKRMATLLSEYKTAGFYSIDFNTTQLSSGIYYYKIIVTTLLNSNTTTSKLVVL